MMPVPLSTASTGAAFVETGTFVRRMRRASG
jgi:hypothetical protein